MAAITQYAYMIYPPGWGNRVEFENKVLTGSATNIIQSYVLNSNK
jgi:hypothetical protein